MCKATVSFVVSCLYVCLSARNNVTLTEWIFVKFYICIFQKFVEKIQVSLKSYMNNGNFTGRSMYNLQEDQCTIFIISHSVLCRMRNTSGRSCRDNQNKFLCLVTFFIITVFIILLFMRQCRKILYSRAGHRCQYGACRIPKAANTCLYCDIRIIMHCDII